MELKFRALTADEIDVRVGKPDIEGVGCALLLYKDARVDMDILDETVGPLNWQRRHCRDNANCILSIWDDEKKQWIEKEDTGTESKTEAEKGLASDSFKRSCVCAGIGRELYSSPYIWVSEDHIKRKKNLKTGKNDCVTRFYVSRIEVSDAKKITDLTIVNDRGEVVFDMHGGGRKPKPKPAPSFQAAAPKGAEPEEKPEPKEMTRLEMLATVAKLYTPDQRQKLAERYKVETYEYMSDDQLSALMDKLRKAGKIE